MSTAKKREQTYGRTFHFLGRYAPVPYAVLDDLKLSALAVRAAAVLARGISYNAWNKDGHVDTTYPELGRKIGKTRYGAMNAIKELVENNHVSVTSLNRGGIRVTFLTRHQDFDLDTYFNWAEMGFFDRDRPLDEQLAQMAEAAPTNPTVAKLRQEVTEWLNIHSKLTAQDYSDAVQAVIARWREKAAKHADEFFTRTGKEWEQSDGAYDRERRELLRLPVRPVANPQPEVSRP